MYNVISKIRMNLLVKPKLLFGMLGIGILLIAPLASSAPAFASPGCPSGYTLLVDSSGFGWQIQGHGKGAAVTTTGHGNCWTENFDKYGNVQFENGDGNCLSWWASSKRFVLADPGCNINTINQLFEVYAVSGGFEIMSLYNSQYVSAFTVSNGSELGDYSGSPIANDTWN